MIRIKETRIEEIEKLIGEIESEISEGYSITEETYLSLYNMLSEREIEKSLELLKNKENKEMLDLADIYQLEESLEKTHQKVKSFREDIELEEFFSKGKLFDVDILKHKWNKKKLYNKYPKFSWEKYEEFIKNPLLKIKNFKGEEIYYDPYIVKKNMIAINEMIFDEMDLFITNIGREGSGKSCLSSQEILWFYTYLHELGLIDYAFDFKKMFFSSILFLLNEYNMQENKDFFRITVLDEGNDLNRKNYHEQENKDYVFDMRSSRKMLRIQIINIQQIGELDLSISLSRINFIYDCRMSNEVKTGTLNKGKVRMIIVPRGENIYSEKHKKNIQRDEVIQLLSNRLDKKKDYYLPLPNEIVCHEFDFEEKWGFDKAKYDDFIKDENKKKLLNKKTIINVEEEYLLYDKLPEVKHWGTVDMSDETDKKKYWRLKKLETKLNMKFNQNPELCKKIESLFISRAKRTKEQKKEIKKIDKKVKQELDDEDLVPEKYKEELEYLPDLTTEKPKTFYKDLNK
jgi:hypothetical protein